MTSFSSEIIVTKVGVSVWRKREADSLHSQPFGLKRTSSQSKTWCDSLKNSQCKFTHLASEECIHTPEVLNFSFASVIAPAGAQSRDFLHQAWRSGQPQRGVPQPAHQRGCSLILLLLLSHSSFFIGFSSSSLSSSSSVSKNSSSKKLPPKPYSCTWTDTSFDFKCGDPSIKSANLLVMDMMLI